MVIIEMNPLQSGSRIGTPAPNCNDDTQTTPKEMSEYLIE
jgi:hypothetical protein